MNTHWNPVQIREVEKASLRAFMESQKHLFTGRVLDFGAGKPGTCAQPQPYRDLVTGEYVPIDKGESIPGGFQSYDAVICTQVVQYLPETRSALWDLHLALKPRHPLALTFPTNWDESEAADLFRFTQAGMRELLGNVGFERLEFTPRGQIAGTSFCLGYGVVAWKP